MNAYLEQLLLPENEVFVHRSQALKAFTARHHFHPELELHFVTEGWGTGFVGNRTYAYTAGDLLLVGSMVPHHWESAAHFAESGVLAASQYIQFPEKLLGPAFARLQAAEAIGTLFQRARRGVRFFGQTARLVGEKILHLPRQTGLKRLLGFLEILDALSQSLEYELILPEGYDKEHLSEADERLKRVFLYIHQNLCGTISLDQAASEASLSKSAFCRFFKNRTLRTFSDFVNELRIYHALRLMREKQMPVARAALESGFNNLGYFHQTYKKFRGTSPGLDGRNGG